MQTAPLSKTASRLSNDELGLIQRRVNEIVRRAEEGTIELPWAMGEIQRIIEGRKLPEVVYRNRAEPLQFDRPSVAERRKSKAPLHRRLAHWVTRLEWPERNGEHIMAEMWEAECIPVHCVNNGRTPINTIMYEEHITDRDIRVISSTLQWLGTSAGKDFLRKFVRTAELYIH
tara:strand:- start:401100 stop:401618 length:519 start_codon:yes stop_codon:yes gene_type:complete